jgi:hypothetical protein
MPKIRKSYKKQKKRSSSTKHKSRFRKKSKKSRTRKNRRIRGGSWFPIWRRSKPKDPLPSVNLSIAEPSNQEISETNKGKMRRELEISENKMLRIHEKRLYRLKNYEDLREFTENKEDRLYDAMIEEMSDIDRKEYERVLQETKSNLEKNRITCMKAFYSEALYGDIEQHPDFYRKYKKCSSAELEGES